MIDFVRSSCRVSYPDMKICKASQVEKRLPKEPVGGWLVPRVKDDLLPRKLLACHQGEQPRRDLGERELGDGHGVEVLRESEFAVTFDVEEVIPLLYDSGDLLHS